MTYEVSRIFHAKIEIFAVISPVDVGLGVRVRVCECQTSILTSFFLRDYRVTGVVRLVENDGKLIEIINMRIYCDLCSLVIISQTFRHRYKVNVYCRN